MRKKDYKQSNQGTQSIRRALDILRIIAMRRDVGMPMHDITVRTGITRPTAHRILGLLIEEGFVEHKSRSRRYMIGEQVSHLALARPAKFSYLLEVSEPHLSKATKLIGDTVFLTIRTQLDTLCIARRIGNFPVQVLSLDVGGRRPLGVSSAGLAILAALPEHQANNVIVENQPLYSSYNATADDIKVQVHNARVLGYALRRRGIVPGTRSVSVAIKPNNDYSLAALTISAVSQRLSNERIQEVIEFLNENAKAIEEKLRQ